MAKTQHWHKSSYSGGSNNNCVEVAESATVLVRDTQHRSLGHIAYPSRAWAAFLNDLKRDRL